MSKTKDPYRTDFNASAIRATVTERFAFLNSWVLGGFTQLMTGFTTMDASQITEGLNNLSMGTSFSKAVNDGKKDLKSNKKVSWAGDSGEQMTGRALDKVVYRVAQDEIYRLSEAHDACHRPQDRERALAAIEHVIHDATKALMDARVIVIKDTYLVKPIFKLRQNDKDIRPYKGPRLPI